jgi:adenosylcobinamide-GDP ribazoletransferase
VGALVGAVAAGTLAVAALVLPQAAAVVLALTAAIVLTGGFHEDGLADVADAAGAHVSRERKLEILSDSRVGTYGALAVALPIVFAVACLAALDEREAAQALVCAHVAGRWTTLPASLLLPHARPDGKGALVRASWAVVAGGSALAAALMVAVAGPLPAAAALGLGAVVVALGGLALTRVFGGITGDGFGALNKLTELAIYGLFAAMLT